MQPFQGDSHTFSGSIALDASTIGNVTVSVCVYATRADEIAILDSIRHAADRTGTTFIPFKSKSHHFDKADQSRFFEEVITETDATIRGLHFEHHSANRNQHYTEGVLSAILVKQLYSTVSPDTVVLFDGDTTKIDVFSGAYAGITDAELPPVTNSYQAELYYPHALLADLTAGYLAQRITSGDYDYADPLLRVPAATHATSDLWGQAFSHLQRNDPPSDDRIGAGTAQGATEQERARIWYSGLMGRTPGDAQTGPAIGIVAKHLRERGYEALAECVESL